MEKIAFERGHASSFTSVPLDLNVAVWIDLHNRSFLVALPSFVSHLCAWEVVFAAHLFNPLGDDLVTLVVGWVLAMLDALRGGAVLPRRLLHILNPVKVSHLRCINTLIKADSWWGTYTGCKVISDRRLIIAHIKEVTHRTIVLWARRFSWVIRGLFV